jgi:Fe-S-cluster-containing dehydrogenase component
MLYDATRCIGCQTCVAACAEANHTSPDRRLDQLHQSPRDLNDTTLSIIKLCKAADGKSCSYMKQQCMHCVDPACAAACMFKALKKEAGTGIVTWDPGRCVGCRYCEIACPYHIPKYQWKGVNPRIVKCEFCKERLAHGQEPACSAICPTHAVIFGKRSSLIEEARQRIAQSPGKYYRDRVFGEREGGGTQVLYLTHAPFAEVGLPALGDESSPARYLKWQKQLYHYLALPSVLYAAMVFVIHKNWKRHKEHLQKDGKSTGLRPQL